VALEAKLSLGTAQRQVMTAALQQAIKLLPLSRLELIERIQQELLENPFLEEVPATEESDNELARQETAETPLDDGRQDFETDWERYLQEEGSYSYENFPTENGRDVPSLESTLSDETSLTDHLLWQLSLSVQSGLAKQIGVYLIGNIDENGYLNCQTGEVSEIFGVARDEVDDILEVIQGFDPSGVGARDLRECLLIQLRQLDMEDSAASCIIRHHLDQIDERNFKRIAKSLRVSLEDVIAAVRFIRELDPKPGSRYVPGRVEYIVPDVYVVRIGDDYHVMLNDDVPKLNISAQYQRLLRRDNGLQEDAKDYMEEKFRSAVWLVKGIEQRRQTLMKVSKSLCTFQRDFLDRGLAYLNPLVLRDVADDIGMHESTVSRVTTNKYIHTPQGIFELKFFFHSGLMSFEGDAMSSVSVKDMIRKMVGAENARKPLTDQQLVAMLEDRNISIARRTVAKYRQELHIPPASRRRRLFDA
jgi:RNA polymerase sigma-54 factor